MSAVLAALVAGAGAAPAGATTLEVGCAELQSTINRVAAENHGAGDTLVLGGLCDTANLKSASGVTLPAGSSFSIEGKPGTTSGFDGEGFDGPLLGTAGSEEAGAMTLDDLTFEHAQLTNASALQIRAARLTLSDDSFLDNEEYGDAHAAFVDIGQSHCPSAGEPPAITLTGSSFSNNKLDLWSEEGGGAGAWLQDTCENARNVIENNAFEGNRLETTEAAEGVKVTGAGLMFVGGATRPASVSQSANVFDSNSIVSTLPADEGNYGGGGEWLEDASLTSVGDRFSRNAIAGTSSGSDESWSWGAGLGVSNLPCDEAGLPESTLENDVVTGNAIGAGTQADLGGGGVWVGCVHLRVLDSTVTLNNAPFGAGIEGEPFDQLELTNSIVAADSGGNELTGFDGEGGFVTAAFSDVCAAAGSNAPLPGAGNICANPLLANDGNPSSVDVEETEASPTIDAGSNALVPAGLNTDFYGNTRILSGRIYTPPCTPGASVSPTLDAPVVDMGASEYGPIAAPAYTIVCVAATTPVTQTSAATASAFSLPSLTLGANGVLTLSFKGLAAGRLSVRATFDVSRSVVTVVKGRRRRTTKTQTLTYGQATRTVTTAGNVTLKLKPTKQTTAEFARDKHPRLRLTITFTATGATPLTRDEVVIVVHRAA